MASLALALTVIDPGVLVRELMPIQAVGLSVVVVNVKGPVTGHAHRDVVIDV